MVKEFSGFAVISSRMRSTSLLLHPAEALVLRITAIAAAMDAVLILVRGSTVDIIGYGFVLALAGALVATGYAYRRSGRSESIGSVTTCAGLFILFTVTLSLFNYLLLPNANPTLDHWLLELDALLGYHWPDAVAWASRHPAVNEFMRFAYLSTLPQVALLLIVLGFSNRLHDLHALMVTITVSGTITVMFWGLFPTTGPSALYSLPEDLLSAVRTVVDTQYGAALITLLRDGSPYLSPDDIRGLIAFPSFHTVLACAATFYARRVWWLLPILLVVNLAVLPAVLVHGGHHLVDIPAGMVVFLISALAAHRMLGWNAAVPVSDRVR
jgi:hypothetical protein